jgi:hypothetical protein
LHSFVLSSGNIIVKEQAREATFWFARILMSEGCFSCWYSWI